MQIIKIGTLNCVMEIQNNYHCNKSEVKWRRRVGKRSVGRPMARFRDVLFKRAGCD